MSKSNSELKKISKKYYEDFNWSCERSREQRLRELQPGDPAPEHGKLYGKYKEQFNEKAREYRSAAAAIFEAEKKAINKKINEAPSQEAVNVLSVLKLRDNITAEHINSMISEYGDNVMFYEAARDLASQKGLTTENIISEHPIREQLARVEAAERSVLNSLVPMDTENGHNTTAYYAIVNQFIDAAFEPDAIQ